MKVDTLKLDLLHWLSSISDESVLAKIRKIQTADGSSKKQYNKELKEAEKEIGQGKGIFHEKAISRIKEWREK
jgi:hypothetical protein